VGTETYSESRSYASKGALSFGERKRGAAVTVKKRKKDVANWYLRGDALLPTRKRGREGPSRIRSCSIGDGKEKKRLFGE